VGGLALADDPGDRHWGRVVQWDAKRVAERAGVARHSYLGPLPGADNKYSGVSVVSDVDHFGDSDPNGGGKARPETPPNPGRRRFSSRALAGGVVLVSLGNRSAWGQTVVGCMSVTTIASFNPVTGMFVSAPGGRPEHDETLAAEIHYVSAPDDVTFIGSGLGTDGTTLYSTCADPNNIDYVCLVEGPDCP